MAFGVEKLLFPGFSRRETILPVKTFIEISSAVKWAEGSN